MIGSCEKRLLWHLLPAEAQRHGCDVVAMEMVANHVHLVIRIPPRFDLPRLLQGFEAASSRAACRQLNGSLTGLKWTKGYQAKTMSPSNLNTIVRNIRSHAGHVQDVRSASIREGRSVVHDASR
jgi:REP element-mobilizing transposase RayT